MMSFFETAAKPSQPLQKRRIIVICFFTERKIGEKINWFAKVYRGRLGAGAHRPRRGRFYLARARGDRRLLLVRTPLRASATHATRRDCSGSGMSARGDRLCSPRPAAAAVLPSFRGRGRRHLSKSDQGGSKSARSLLKRRTRGPRCGALHRRNRGRRLPRRVAPHRTLGRTANGLLPPLFRLNSTIYPKQG